MKNGEPLGPRDGGLFGSESLTSMQPLGMIIEMVGAPEQSLSERVGLLKERFRSARAIEFLHSCFDEINHLIFQAHVIERIDFLNTGGTGYIDFGKKTADDIKTDEV